MGHQASSLESLVQNTVLATCPGCGARSMVEPKAIGRKLRCRKCGFIFRFSVDEPTPLGNMPEVAPIQGPPPFDPGLTSRPALDAEANAESAAVWPPPIEETLPLPPVSDAAEPATQEESTPPEAPVVKASAARRAFRIWSYILVAIGALAVIPGFVLASMQQDAEAARTITQGTLLGCIGLGAVGLVLGLASFDRGAATRAPSWMAVIWSICLVGALVLLLAAVRGII